MYSYLSVNIYEGLSTASTPGMRTYEGVHGSDALCSLL